MQFNRNSNRGFGLIELLLVLAIIGILVGLVLASTDKSRRKSQDVRIKSDIRQLRVLAETYFNISSNGYSGFETCVEAPTPADCLEQRISDDILTLRADVEDAYGQADIIDAASSTAGFCVTAPLRTEASSYICADGAGEVHEGVSSTSPCDLQTTCTFD